MNPLANFLLKIASSIEEAEARRREINQLLLAEARSL
jgi:hypothetical protein